MKKKITISLTELELRMLLFSAAAPDTGHAKPSQKAAFWRAAEKLMLAHSARNR